ncbi:MAG: hypothetical protein AAFQ98_18400, partial [Bacteroidota bacterium]
MTKTYYLFLTALLCSSCSLLFPEEEEEQIEVDFVLSSQTAIDNFFSRFISDIEGNVLISTDVNTSDPITNLDGLLRIQSIGGDLRISGNRSLTSLNGLSTLRTVGGTLILSANYELVNLQGLDNLEAINGSFLLSSNISLETLRGLENLAT